MATKFKNILITGATSGIGEGLAYFYAASGAENIFICGRNKERLNLVTEQCKNFGAKVHPEILDITDRDATLKWINESDKKAKLNLVIANAGVASLIELDENIYRTFDTNVYGVLHTVLPAINIFRERKKDTSPRAIAMLSSIAGYHGLPTCPSYSASKACVKAYGEALRIPLSKENIQVNVICPGFVKSRITDKNTCPMPFFWQTEKAAAVIGERIEKNVALIAFPWQMRIAAWFGSILPNWLSNFIYSKLPYKV